jgi:hypothetical protein
MTQCQMLQTRFTFKKDASVKHRVANVRYNSASVTLVQRTCDRSSTATDPTHQGENSLNCKVQRSRNDGRRWGPRALNIYRYEPPTGRPYIIVIARLKVTTATNCRSLTPRMNGSGSWLSEKSFVSVYRVYCVNTDNILILIREALVYYKKKTDLMLNIFACY